MTEPKAPLATKTEESVYASMQTFENAQRMAKSLAQSNLVPDLYRGQNGFANCLVALEIANRMNMSPLQVMQNMNIIKGKPSWGSQFVIALITGCGRFEDFDYVMSGKGEALACRCVAIRKRDKKKIEGSIVSLKMAKDEGWTSNPKWRTMPEHMLRYRAATFFGRQHVADLLVGIQTEEEIIDIEPVDVTEVVTEKKQCKVHESPHQAAIAEPSEKEDDAFGF